jgi:uncharacterized protein YdiU (UPF0061 family)
MRSFDTLELDNSFARLGEGFYSPQAPTPVSDPYLVSFNSAAAKLIGLDPALASSEDFVAICAGNRLPPGASPLAALYAGHQFGHFVAQLGDGRAILLGEVRTSTGQRWDLQLKGAGRTPYSRDGDGRAVLRSTVREYLCSEAMHGLGIPTTRALCIVGTDEEVYRERIETGAVLLRIAPSHVRFGSFEVFYHRRRPDRIAALADYVIEHHFPHLVGREDRHAVFFGEVVRRTAELIARWQAVGFTHGVMNTDNMSVLGLTLDYGPFGFMDAYRPDFVCNHSDYHGRYAFDRQPSTALWNLGCFARALSPLVEAERLHDALTAFEPELLGTYADLMCAKLGLATREREDGGLIAGFLDLMAADGVDYTIAFRHLADFSAHDARRHAGLRDLFIDRDGFDRWARGYTARLVREGSDDAARAARMRRVNPKYVLRNHMAQIAIEKAERQRDFSEIDRLLKLLREPFAEQPSMEPYAAEPPDWARHLELSCSS